MEKSEIKAQIKAANFGIARFLADFTKGCFIIAAIHVSADKNRGAARNECKVQTPTGGIPIEVSNTVIDGVLVGETENTDFRTTLSVKSDFTIEISKIKRKSVSIVDSRVQGFAGVVQ